MLGSRSRWEYLLRHYIWLLDCWYCCEVSPVTLRCPICKTVLGRVVVAANGWATFFFNDVPSHFCDVRRFFFCEQCRLRPEMPEAA